MLADVLLKIQAMKSAEAEQKQYYPRPSLAGPERCLRQLMYWARGEKQRALPGRAVQVLEDSSWAEELTADLMRQSAFQVHSEQMPISVPNAFPWMTSGTWHCVRCETLDADPTIPYTTCHGHIDWVFTDILSNDRLCEHKALSHFGFENIRKGDIPYDYLTQMAIYLRGLQRDNPDIREGILLIKNKNQSGYIEIRCAYDTTTDTLDAIDLTHHTGERQEIHISIDNITNNAFARFGEIDKHLKAKTLPARQYELDSWRCDYCQYNAICWQNCEEEHETLIEDVAMEGEIVDLIKYERECARQESEIKEERKKLKEGIKKILKASGVRKGKAGDYLIEWKVTKTKRLDTDLIPPGAYKQALVTVPSEKIDIKRIKGEQGK